ncbi:hypothetical protein D3C86_1714920 [compost metagenome]
MLGVNRTVGQKRIAKPTDGCAHHVQLIVDLPVGGKLFVLHNHRHIVDAPLFWQAQQSTFVIFDEH